MKGANGCWWIHLRKDVGLGYVQVKTVVDCFAEVGWMGFVTESVVVGDWDCVVAVVSSLGKMVARSE
jgi:hypothetical protein